MRAYSVLPVPVDIFVPGVVRMEDDAPLVGGTVGSAYGTYKGRS